MKRKSDRSYSLAFFRVWSWFVLYRGCWGEEEEEWFCDEVEGLGEGEEDELVGIIGFICL